MTDALKHAEQQMLMARPWHAAEPGSIWDITGDYRNGHGTFTNCLAMVLPEHVTGGPVLFKMLGMLGAGYDVVSPDQITHAVPLILVHRSDPGEAYYASDQAWLRDRR